MKNDYEVRGDVTAIFLKSKKYGNMEALISTSKLGRVNEFPNSWFANLNKLTQSFYVHGCMPRNKKKRVTVSLHRWVTNAPETMQVDHFNHETLDNVDTNLRIVTQAENLQNKKGAHIDGTSGIRGVTWNKQHKKWHSQIQINNKHINLGYSNTIEEAEILCIK